MVLQRKEKEEPSPFALLNKVWKTLASLSSLRWDHCWKLKLAVRNYLATRFIVAVEGHGRNYWEKDGQTEKSTHIYTGDSWKRKHMANNHTHTFILKWIVIWWMFLQQFDNYQHRAMFPCVVILFLFFFSAWPFFYFNNKKPESPLLTYSSPICCPSSHLLCLLVEEMRRPVYS